MAHVTFYEECTYRDLNRRPVNSKPNTTYAELNTARKSWSVHSFIRLPDHSLFSLASKKSFGWREMMNGLEG